LTADAALCAGPVLVSGATGLVGRRLVTALLHEGASVRALTRTPAGAALDPRVRAVGWDGSHVPGEALTGAGAVVHLAGEPIFAGRLSAARRRRIRTSRIDSASALAVALEALPAAERPATLVCASAVGYYGTRADEVLEESAAPGEGFLAEVCVEWERAAQRAARHGVRVACLRIGVVLAREGGALPKLALPFRLGLGGRFGDGRQWFPWIHADDVVGLALAALRDDAWRGPVNAVAPQSVTNAQLTRTLSRVLRRPAPLPVPAFLLRTALGELSGELLGSRRVVPAAALERDFAFGYPELEPALANELG
jgi:uncharacterized protein (TIGR01777 family)